MTGTPTRRYFGSPLPDFCRAQQPDDQVQPLHLAPRLPLVELRPGPVGVQAAVLVCVEQAVEVEAGRPLVFGLQDRLGVVQPDPADMLCQGAVGACQSFRRGVQTTVGRVYLLYESVAVRRPSSPRPPPVSASVSISHTLSGSRVPRWVMCPQAS